MSVMRKRLVLRTAVAVAALVPAGVSAAGAQGTAAGCSAGDAMTWASTTASYRFELHIGMPEQMYTPAQVKTMHPKSGEVMVGGMMSTGGMSMGNSSMRHLEVQICSRKTGKVITNASPTIDLNDAMNMTTHVPVAMMRGVAAGMDDMHYGNNVKMPLGQKLTVKVTVTGETAVFRVRVPK